MEKEEFIESLQVLAEKEDVLATRHEIKELRQKFEDYTLEATRQYQIAELKAKEKEEEFNEEDWVTPLKEKFYTHYSEYNERYKSARKKKQEEEESNLQTKRSLIKKLQEVIQQEENIGAAFAKQKAINTKWKETGPVPRKLSHEIQQEYSRLLEDFFYNINIYKEIKDYDFQKNYEEKKKLIKDLQTLLEEESIPKVQEGIKKIQDAWDTVGPTKQELWEEIKDKYWSTVNDIYKRIHDYYETRREEQKENLEKKKKLIEQAVALVDQPRGNLTAWNKQTQQLLDLQKQWKAIGYGPSRKEDNAAWKNFRIPCDVFFKEKKEFFKDVHKEYEAIATEKKKLIEKAETLKENTDWGNTTKAFIQLQKEWKNLGNAGQKYEQKLWKQFRAACDVFFNAKDTHNTKQEKEFETNLAKKKELISAIQSYQPKEGDKKATIAQLKNFAKEFAAIGFVPRKEKDAIFKAYKKALDTQYKNLDIDGQEKEKILFQARIDTLKGNSDASYAFKKEKQKIRHQMEGLKKEIMKLESNFDSFFAHSKGDNPLKDRAKENIQKEKNKLMALKTQLKMIPNE